MTKQLTIQTKYGTYHIGLTHVLQAKEFILGCTMMRDLIPFAPRKSWLL